MASRGSTPGAEAGFSLVEILVTVLIIGILAAISLSAYMSHRDAARIAAVQSDLRHGFTVATSELATTGELPADFDALIAAGHRPSMDLHPQEGADVRYRPDDECLSIAHPAMPHRPFKIDFDHGELVEGECEE